MRAIRYIPLLAIFLLGGTSVVYASATVGTISADYKYAWSNVDGYVSFAPSQGGLTVADSSLTGYAWSANSGYINFDTNLSGVTNDGEGNLGGYAWDEGVGWISFSGVTIDSSGQFGGTAQGGTVDGVPYAINFDCTHCDVRTDWRPISVRAETDPDPDTGGSSSGPSDSGDIPVSTPPDSELPEEPTMPPPDMTNTTEPSVNADSEGMSGTAARGEDVNGVDIPGAYPANDFSDPSTSNALGLDETTDASAPSDKRPFLIGGISLFFFLLFLYRRSKVAS